MKVLVATDGSEYSMKAVQRALELAEKQGAQVTLMSVAYYVADYLEGMPPNTQNKLEGEAREALKKGKARLTNLYNEHNQDGHFQEISSPSVQVHSESRPGVT
ncbi:MAG: hypothetical protein COS90_10895 [Deltaproteobacteria bacterium CG07_land_8_20_14_0_80_60_11]|nr:MAG: hypothetical protein COS90_10895 [Deltaproteobacteria bacterium CG07_land_8_20_14_0_80_60_11]